MKALFPVSVTCLTFCLLGCERADENMPYYRLPDSAVVAAVGEARCTKEDVQRNEEIMSRLVALCGTAAKVDPEAFRRNYTAAFVVQAILVRKASTASSFATNAWKSIRAGNEFDVVGQKLLEMGKNAAYEAESAVPPGKLADLPVGAVSPLTATEGGLSIWKAKTDASNRKSYSRISFSIPSVDAAFDTWLEEQKKAPDVVMKIK